MPPPLIGSLCSGYGGLDLAALAVFGGTVAWHAETDPDASRVLAHRFPGVPNLGDLTKLDWSTVPRVDVLAAGYPCQPESLAGKRKGAADERWIWPDIAHAVHVLRPRIVLLENVAGHLSLGFRTVLGDLAELGFDAEWLVCKASDLGAAHPRARLFALAWPADPEGLGRDQGLLPLDSTAEQRRPGHPPGQAHGIRLTDRAPRPAGRGTGLLPTPRASDGDKGGPNQRFGSGDPALSAAVQPARWGRYAPAITRHQHLIGRPAPDPTEPGPHGPRLAPRFTEWLMALPDGWVTDVPDLPRAAQLRILGNGVIPPHAEAAYRYLLARTA